MTNARRAFKATSWNQWWGEFNGVLRENWRNWSVFVLFVVGFLMVEYVTTPFERHLTPRALDDVKYPFDRHGTIPGWMVPIYGLVLPVVFAVMYHVVTNSEIREFHDLLFSVLINIAITAAATGFLKETLGRPRPNFFERCYGDTYSLTETLPFDNGHPPDCTNPNKAEVEEGRRSFPSGHSSWAMCSMFYITLFLIGKMQVFDGRGHVWKLVVSLTPTWLAIVIGITRIDDYMHHWTDVVAGWLLGMLVSTMVYHMYYPCPFARSGSEHPLYMHQHQIPHVPIRQHSGHDDHEVAMEEGMGALNIQSSLSKEHDSHEGL